MMAGVEGLPGRAVGATDDTLYFGFGFGFEGISGVENRNAVMGGAINYLLR